MNTLWIVVIATVVIYLAYNFYARRIDRDVIKADAKRATPATMYMDGVDFMPTSKNVLYGYHFKSIAAAGPIVGPITAANLWGWFPSLLWLVIGVSFIGWVSDYSAIMVAVRNDGNSLSAISHKLIAPRTRTILFIFIFFYLMLLAGAFVGILAAILSARPDVPFGIIMLALMGLLAGQMMYRWKMNLILVTAIVVTVTLGAMALGPWGQTKNEKGGIVQGPVGAAVVSLNASIDNLNGKQPILSLEDPTNADPRIPAAGADGKRPTTPAYDAATKQIRTLPNYLLWMVFLFAFSYCGANMPIWRFAQPVNYIGFWIMLITIVLSAIGALVAPLTGVVDAGGKAIGAFALDGGEGPRLRGSGQAVHGLAAALADAVRHDRLWRDLRLARARRLGRHGAAARVRDRRPPGRRRLDVRRVHARPPLARGRLDRGRRRRRRPVRGGRRQAHLRRHLQLRSPRSSARHSASAPSSSSS